MPYECHFTGKKTSFGKQRTYRGQRIVKGGFGLKPTGITRRTFRPNLQKVNALVPLTDGEGNIKTDANGEPIRKTQKIYASARAIKTGLVVKPLKRKYGYTRQQKLAGN